MTFKEFKNTDDYFMAMLLELYYEDGEEVDIVDYDNDYIDNNEVVAVNKSESCVGLIEVILKR